MCLTEVFSFMSCYIYAFFLDVAPSSLLISFWRQSMYFWWLRRIYSISLSWALFIFTFRVSLSLSDSLSN